MVRQVKHTFFVQEVQGNEEVEGWIMIPLIRATG